MIQEEYKQTKKELYSKIKSDDYSFAAFNFSLHDKEPTRINKLYKVVKEKYIKPGLIKLEELGLIRLEDQLIKPTSLGIEIYEEFKR